MTVSCFQRLGFHIWHLPGVSRAWRYEMINGSCVLITDLGGYDLPEPNGPYAAIALSSTDDLIEVQTCLRDPQEAVRWFRRILRSCGNAASDVVEESI
jgi:hypothetical protein